VGEGLDRAAAFYAAAVAPVVERRIARERYSAALIGWGSEVLGLDDDRSTDHNWGPRLQLFLPDDSGSAELTALTAELAAGLPETFGGRPVRYELTTDPVARPRVEVTTRSSWFRSQAGFDPLAAIGLPEWLGVPMWRLAELTAGRVFHDGPGELTRTRAAIAWYPDDLWRWVLAAQWQRIGQEEAFPGRCAERGDRLGAAVLTARLAREVMRVWLLMGRVYPPYAKWFGTAFAGLAGTESVRRDLERALVASTPAEQATHLGAALVKTARRHNELRLGPRVPETLRPFHDRPFLVIGGEAIAATLVAGIGDARLRALPLTGVCDQYVDSTDALGQRRLIEGATRGLLESGPGA